MDEIEKASELNRKETNKPQVFYAVDATVFLDQVDWIVLNIANVYSFLDLSLSNKICFIIFMCIIFLG